MNPIDEENINYSLNSPDSQKHENDIIDMNAMAYEGVKGVNCEHLKKPVINKYKREGKNDKDKADNDVIKPRSQWKKRE